MLAACSPKKNVPEAAPALQAASAGPVIGGAPRPAALPRAVVYRMSGDATAANVPVTVNASGEIVSYPAPTDLEGTAPLAVADGYLLDRRGISAQSRFLRYTYAEYSALSAPPTLAELREAIIPGARVVDMHVLQGFTPSEAAADTAAVNALIRNF